MNSSHKHGWRSSLSGLTLLGFLLTVASTSVLTGCDDGKSQMKMSEQTDNPAVIAKDSMDAYKNAHLKGGAGKKQ